MELNLKNIVRSVIFEAASEIVALHELPVYKTLDKINDGVGTYRKKIRSVLNTIIVNNMTTIPRFGLNVDEFLVLDSALRNADRNELTASHELMTRTLTRLKLNQNNNRYATFLRLFFNRTSDEFATIDFTKTKLFDYYYDHNVEFINKIPIAFWITSFYFKPGVSHPYYIVPVYIAMFYDSQKNNYMFNLFSKDKDFEILNNRKTTTYLNTQIYIKKVRDIFSAENNIQDIDFTELMSRLNLLNTYTSKLYNF